jgi:DNA polymerase-3 subunit alpha
LTLQNLPGLIKYDLIPNDEEYTTARRVFEFNRYLKAMCKDTNEYYKLDERAFNFLVELGYEDLIAEARKINIKLWEKKYQMWMDVFRNWINENKEELLKALNATIFKEEWDKYASGTVSAWEMEALCFYYHEHELYHLDNNRYGISNYFILPEDPIVERSFQKAGKTINLFKLTKIAGTCIAKDKAKATVTLLTPNGVVNVKFRKEYFAMFDKQISIKQADGTKKVIEKSWFNRGSMIMVQGMRSGDNFMSKKYASSGGHQLYRISTINEDGSIELQDQRYQGGIEEDV